MPQHRRFKQSPKYYHKALRQGRLYWGDCRVVWPQHPVSPLAFTDALFGALARNTLHPLNAELAHVFGGNLPEPRRNVTVEDGLL